MSEKSLQQTLDLSKGDAICKHILSHKDILARILVGYVQEFHDCSFDDVANKYIEDDISVSDTHVHRGEFLQIKGDNNEDTTVDEGTVKYDIKFTAKTPEDSGSIELIINIEAQNNFSPGYSLVKRALYYCSRLVSAQYGTEFTHSDYDKIKKVYSIWICTNPLQNARHTVTSFDICYDKLLGSLDINREDYDIMKVIMVCLGDPNANYEEIKEAEYNVKQKEALKFLDTVFSVKIDKKDKVERLKSEFDFNLDSQLDEEVSSMCNVSRGWYREGVEEGREEGIALSLKSLMKGSNLSIEKAMELLNIPITEKEKYKRIIASLIDN